MHPLTRAAGDDVNSPIDPNYPGRYYVDPECREFETDQTKDIRSAGGYVMTMNYQLPAGLTCTHCTLQMINCETRRVFATFLVGSRAACLAAIWLQETLDSPQPIPQTSKLTKIRDRHWTQVPSPRVRRVQPSIVAWRVRTQQRGLDRPQPSQVRRGKVELCGAVLGVLRLFHLWW